MHRPHRLDRTAVTAAFFAIALTGLSCSRAATPAPAPSPRTASMPPTPAPVRLPAPPTRREWPAYDPRARLTAAQAKWIDSTLASLPLRERIGQMVMVWVLGDYTSYGDSTFAEVRRWIERDHIGGVSMSLGTPIEVAAKIN